MGETNIQWCDFSFNGWIGCRKVAPECLNCYAETLDRNRFSKTMPGCSKEKPISHWGRGPRYRTSESNWREPLKWNKKAAEAVEDAMHDFGEERYIAPQRPRVFCASLSDFLDDENVPIEWLADLLKLIHDTPNLDWLLLSKRTQNWEKRITEAAEIFKEPMLKGTIHSWLWGWLSGVAPENIWIGVSAGADQAASLQIPAKIHFLSCEPMLRPMDTTHAARFAWTIFGGESGKNARPCNAEWIRQGVKFCREHNVTPFVKQLGAKVWDGEMIPEHMLSLNNSNGADMSEWPEDLRVREFPTAK